MNPFEEIPTALRYPWDDGDAGVTLVIGGILTLVSPLVVPGLLVLGYGLRVIEAVLDDEPSPPGFGEPVTLFVQGVKGAVVLLAYAVLPLLAGLVVLVGLADLAGFGLRGGLASLVRAMAAGGVALVIALLMAGLFLVVAYVTPAALVHLGRTHRLRAAFAVDDVKGLATADAYASAWLLALAVFALAGVVLAVLNAAAIGVVVSGFVTFYAFVAMTGLYGDGAAEAGYELDRPDGSTD